MYKIMNEGKKSMENSSPLYQTYTPTVIIKKKKKKNISGPSYRRQVIHPQPQSQPISAGSMF